MDPQQRLLLETSTNGLLDAGLTKQELMGSEALASVPPCEKAHVSLHVIYI